MKKEKQKLQEVSAYPLRTIKESLDYLGWKYTKDEDTFNDIMCCGKPVKCSGFFGTADELECEVCGKKMHNMFGVTFTGNATAVVLDPTNYDYEEGRHWVAIDIPDTQEVTDV